MIIYNSYCGGFNLLLSKHAWWGSPIIKGFPFGVISLLIAILFRTLVSQEYLEYVLQRETFMIHPYPYQLFAYLVGFVIIFRTQQSYGRFWEARTAIQQMSSKWVDAITMILAFDRPENYSGSKSYKEHFEFGYQMAEYMSLMHALAMMDVRMDTNLENIRFEQMPKDESSLSLFFNNSMENGARLSKKVIDSFNNSAGPGRYNPLTSTMSFTDEIERSELERNSSKMDSSRHLRQSESRIGGLTKMKRGSTFGLQVAAPSHGFVFDGAKPRHASSPGKRKSSLVDHPVTQISANVLSPPAMSPPNSHNVSNNSNMVTSTASRNLTSENLQELMESGQMPADSVLSVKIPGTQSGVGRQRATLSRMSLGEDHAELQKSMMKQKDPTMTTMKVEAVQKKFQDHPFTVICSRAEITDTQDLQELQDVGVRTDGRVMITMTWIQMLIMNRLKNKDSTLNGTPGPIVSRVHQVLSDGSLGWHQARKIMDTPFPFAYAELISFFLLLFMCTAPILCVAFLEAEWMAYLLSLMSVWVYFSLNELARVLEKPYDADDANDLPLTLLQHEFNHRIWDTVRTMLRNGQQELFYEGFVAAAPGKAEVTNLAALSRNNSLTVDGGGAAKVLSRANSLQGTANQNSARLLPTGQALNLNLESQKQASAKSVMQNMARPSLQSQLSTGKIGEPVPPMISEL